MRSGKPIEAKPFCDTRLHAISANEPAVLETLTAGLHAIVLDRGNRRIPQHANAYTLGGANEMFMQNGAANTEARALRKFALRRERSIQKFDSVKDVAMFFGDLHTKTSERCEGVWHQTFPASFLDGK